MLDLARWRVDTQHYYRDPSLPDAFGDQFPAVVLGIVPGDVVWFAPAEKHWRGATPTTAMTHIAIQEALNVKVVERMEKVSDEQYQKKG